MAFCFALFVWWPLGRRAAHPKIVKNLFRDHRDLVDCLEKMAIQVQLVQLLDLDFQWDLEHLLLLEVQYSLVVQYFLEDQYFPQFLEVLVGLVLRAQQDHKEIKEIQDKGLQGLKVTLGHLDLKEPRAPVLLNPLKAI
jgi:hypothetical protein